MRATAPPVCRRDLRPFCCSLSGPLALRCHDQGLPTLCMFVVGQCGLAYPSTSCCAHRPPFSLYRVFLSLLMINRTFSSCSPSYLPMTSPPQPSNDLSTFVFLLIILTVHCTTLFSLLMVCLNLHFLLIFLLPNNQLYSAF